MLYKFWRIFPGIFLDAFSGHFFPPKMRRKNPARKSAKKSGGSKIKIREKSVLPKAGPKRFTRCSTSVREGSLYMGKMGSICHFPRALPASIWGHCSQVLVFTSIWGSQKGCENDIFRAVFPSIWGSWDPQQRKRKMTNRPCFAPPPVYPLGNAHVSQLLPRGLRLPCHRN